MWALCFNRLSPVPQYRVDSIYMTLGCIKIRITSRTSDFQTIGFVTRLLRSWARKKISLRVHPVFHHRLFRSVPCRLLTFLCPFSPRTSKWVPSARARVLSHTSCGAQYTSQSCCRSATACCWASTGASPLSSAEIPAAAVSFHV